MKTIEFKSGQSVYFCTCGKSSKFPFCDGTHKLENQFKPRFKVYDQDAIETLCECGKCSQFPLTDYPCK